MLGKEGEGIENWKELDVFTRPRILEKTKVSPVLNFLLKYVPSTLIFLYASVHPRHKLFHSKPLTEKNIFNLTDHI